MLRPPRRRQQNGAYARANQEKRLAAPLYGRRLRLLRQSEDSFATGVGWLSINRPTPLQFEHDPCSGEQGARRIIRSQLNRRTSQAGATEPFGPFGRAIPTPRNRIVNVSEPVAIT